MNNRNSPGLGSETGSRLSAAYRYLALAAIALGFYLSDAPAAFPQGRTERTSATVGMTRSKVLKRKVRPGSVVIDPNPVGLARVEFDYEKNELRWTGLRPGVTTVTFKGDYAAAGGVGNENQNQPGGGGGFLGGLNRPSGSATPFTFTIRINVVAPGTPEPDTGVIDIEVESGRSRQYRAHDLLGPEFGDPRNEGRRWRNLRLEPDDSDVGVAAATLTGRRIEIEGIEVGHATVTLTGERFVNGQWQQVARELRVFVSPQPVGDPVFDRLRRQHAQLQPSVKAGADGDLTAERKAEVLRSLEGLAELLESGIRNLEAAPDSSAMDIVRRQHLLSDVQRDIRRLGGEPPIIVPPGEKVRLRLDEKSEEATVGPPRDPR